jgi:hypothetical protein
LGEIEDHHIYPKRFLAANGVRGTRANWIVNRTPSLKSTNGNIGADAPNIYLADESIVGREGVGASVLERHGIPRETVLAQFSRENYGEFLEEQKMSLLIKIEEAVEFRVLPETQT